MVLCGITVSISALVVFVWRSFQIDALERACADAERNRDWQKLFDSAAQWTVTAPRTPQAWFALSTAALNLNQPEKSWDSLYRIPEFYPRYDEVLERKMLLAFTRLRKPIDGVDACEQLLARRYALPLAQFHLAWFYAMTFQLDRLNTQCRQAVEQFADSPEHFAYLMILDDFLISNGEEETSLWITNGDATETTRTAQLLHRIARLKRMRDDSPATGSEIRRLRTERRERLAQYPESVPLQISELEFCVETQDLERAFTILASADAAERKSWVLERFRATLLMHQNELSAAEQALETALQLNPLSWAARGLLADCLRRQNRSDDAAQQQQLAALGAEVAIAISSQKQLSEISHETLRKLAEFASGCKDWTISSGLRRRLRPGRTAGATYPEQIP